MKNILILLIILLLTGCSAVKPIRVLGTYRSTCVLYTEPSLIATLNEDNSFVYNLPFGEKATGTWKLNADTLVLYSDKFQTADQLAPTYKFTNLDGQKDAFLVKGSKLYLINKEGSTKGCYLKKQK
jgi:hypothetical protein